VGVRFEDSVLDLAAAGLGEVFRAPSLNAFMAQGRSAWEDTRGRVRELLERGDELALVGLDDVELQLPFEPADFVDFYSSLEHATNMGRMLRPAAEPLLPNWRWLPVGYHGRAGTILVSGTPIVRPSGQAKSPEEAAPMFGPSKRLDIELELGVVVGTPSSLGQPVEAAAAREHVFGIVLVNDWSARDIQAWEYQPLGPFLGKSFATSISAWVVPFDALEPYRVPGPEQEPPVLDYLAVPENWAFDIELEVGLKTAEMAGPEVVSRTNARYLYWNVDQQVAHATVNGASLRTGDLLASGTISGQTPESRGSFIELTWNGQEPLELADGSRRTFLEDGDEVVLRGLAGGDIALGEVWGRIAPAT
jgi:fumarylacetoacetase